jgi:HAD superfamily hydrolase (TIGR01459 family)
LSLADIPTIEGLSELAPLYDAILCDVWGVLIDGVSHFPAAAAALSRYRGGGGRVVLITNASRPSQEVARQLDRLRLPRDSYDAIISAGELTLREIVARRDQACHHLGPARDVGLFEAAAQRIGAPLRMARPEAADYVVCTGLIDEENETPQDYDARLRALLEHGLTMLCANPDVVVGVGERLYYCAGALARRYAGMGGAVQMFGKPHPAIYEAARAQIEALRGGSEHGAADCARVLAVGDGAETDLLGATRANLDCLFITHGVHRDELLGPEGELDESALERLFAKVNARPTALAREVVW